MCEYVDLASPLKGGRLTIYDGMEFLVEQRITIGNVGQELGGAACLQCCEPGGEWHDLAFPEDGQGIVVEPGTRLRLRLLEPPDEVWDVLVPEPMVIGRYVAGDK